MKFGRSFKSFYGRDRQLLEKDENEKLPHRPDAFFGLHYHDLEGDEKTHYYFYEADRKTMNVPKMNRKFRSHFHYVVKRKLHSEHTRGKQNPRRAD